MRAYTGGYGVENWLRAQLEEAARRFEDLAPVVSAENIAVGAFMKTSGERFLAAARFEPPEDRNKLAMMGEDHLESLMAQSTPIDGGKK